MRPIFSAHRRNYQPSSAGGTNSPPATPAKIKMVARAPQNGRQGLERGPPLGFSGWGGLLAFLRWSSFLWCLHSTKPNLPRQTKPVKKLQHQ